MRCGQVWEHGIPAPDSYGKCITLCPFHGRLYNEQKSLFPFTDLKYIIPAFNEILLRATFSPKTYTRKFICADESCPHSESFHKHKGGEVLSNDNAVSVGRSEYHHEFVIEGTPAEYMTLRM